MLNKDNPQITLIITAVDSVNNKIGIINVKAKKNLAKKVHTVDIHISLAVCLFSDS